MNAKMERRYYIATHQNDKLNTAEYSCPDPIITDLSCK
jgi:hypothetical protein